MERMDPLTFIAKYAPYAQEAHGAYGVPASVALAMGALESGWGGSSLVDVFNFHGIKAANTPGRADNPYRSGVVNKVTGEFFDGWTTVTAAFLAFPNARSGFMGFGYFLARRGLYGAAFMPTTTVADFVRAVAAAGYATDPAYVGKVITIISAYGLTRYDVATTPTGGFTPMRIAICPSSQEHNACAVGDTEQAHTRLIAARVVALLQSAGHQAKSIIVADDNLSDSAQLAGLSAASNAYGPDLHIDIHTDAGGATGPSAFYIGEGRSKTLGLAVYDELRKAVPYTPNGVRERGTLWMLRKTTATAVLVECWPHDRAAQAKWGHAHIEDVAVAITKGILRVAGGKLPTTPVVVVTPVVNPKPPARPQLVDAVNVAHLKASRYGDPGKAGTPLGAFPSEVLTLETALVRARYLGGAVDGHYGTATVAAVMSFQAERSGATSPDGWLGHLELVRLFGLAGMNVKVTG